MTTTATMATRITATSPTSRYLRIRIWAIPTGADGRHSSRSPPPAASCLLVRQVRGDGGRRAVPAILVRPKVGYYARGRRGTPERPRHAFLNSRGGLRAKAVNDASPQP